ncbi:hypothetical protein M1O18_02710 [Dehalococcoidia bacterium]|nr:hypothetical protein [Dehalococcoidia bacterium]
MDVDHFLTSLLHALSKVDFVEKVDLKNEVFVLKGRAILRNNRFLQVYFNELTGTTSVALIEEDKRRWGIDFDNIRGWHVHPLKDPGTHHSTDTKEINEIIDQLTEVRSQLP